VPEGVTRFSDIFLRAGVGIVGGRHMQHLTLQTIYKDIHGTRRWRWRCEEARPITWHSAQCEQLVLPSSGPTMCPVLVFSFFPSRAHTPSHCIWNSTFKPLMGQLELAFQRLHRSS